MRRTGIERPARPVATALRVVTEREPGPESEPGPGSGTLAEAAVVRGCEGDEVGLAAGATARIAPSCLVRPEPGDRVLVWGRSGERFVLAVLARGADRDAPAVIGSRSGLVLEAPRVSVRAESVHVRAGEVLTSARAVHEVSGISTRSAEVRVADIGTDVRRAKNARDEVEGTLVERFGAWVSDTAREARIAARAMLFG